MGITPGILLKYSDLELDDQTITLMVPGVVYSHVQRGSSYFAEKSPGGSVMVWDIRPECDQELKVWDEWGRMVHRLD